MSSHSPLRFFKKRYLRRLIYLLCLSVFAVYELSNMEVVRRTFIFYGLADDFERVEERMLPSLPSEELEIKRYVEEAILGPKSPESDLLFSRATRLRSLLLRDGVIYADLSEEAALPTLEIFMNGEILSRNLSVLEDGIKRNFPSVAEVKLFINGFRVET